MKNLTLKQAREQGKTSDFVNEHKADPDGDPDAFNRTLASMAGKSKEARKASSAGNADD